MEINLTLQQKQTLAQSQIQSLNILSFNSIELNQFLHEEYLENPLLNYSETVPDIISFEPITSYKNDDFSLNNTKLEDSFIKDYLMHQLDLTRYNTYELNLIHYLIDCLDDIGYFHFSIDEISEATNANPDIIKSCLNDLKSLEPSGIFSANLADCLISQLDPAAEGYLYMKKIISDHLEDIAYGKISTISRALHLSSANVRKYIDRIRLLNPKPLSGFVPDSPSYIVPDIIFSKEKGFWDITLNDNWITNYHLNDYYISMLDSTTDPELVAYFEKKLKSIQFIFACIQQRRKTLLAIAREILEEQKDFFNLQCELKPMTMTSLSKKLGIHPSTVSRAIKGKYIQYPGNSILCKDLFSTSVTSASDTGDLLSKSNIKLVIKELIDKENKSTPLSDQTIVKLLKGQDISISRRTVAKYRLELGIGSSAERKECL